MPLSIGAFIAVSLARHRRLHAKLRDQLAVVVGAVLNAAIGVMDQSRGWALATYRPPQGLRRQVLRHSWSHRVANQLARKNVFHSGQVQPTFVGHHVRDVGHPGVVRPGWRERLVQQVFGHWESMARVRRRLELALLLAPQAQLLPQPYDAVTPCIEPLRDQVRLQPQRPVGLTSLNMRSVDRHLQPLIVLCALGRRALHCCIEAAARRR